MSEPDRNLLVRRKLHTLNGMKIDKLYKQQFPGEQARFGLWSVQRKMCNKLLQTLPEDHWAMKISYPLRSSAAGKMTFRELAELADQYNLKPEPRETRAAFFKRFYRQEPQLNCFLSDKNPHRLPLISREQSSSDSFRCRGRTGAGKVPRTAQGHGRD